MMLLGTGLGTRGSLSAPPIADLTDLEAQMAFGGSDDLFNFVSDFVMCPYLFGRQAKPVGGIILAAVSHHEHLEAPGQRPNCIPIGLREIAVERLAVKPSVL